MTLYTRFERSSDGRDCVSVWLEGWDAEPLPPFNWTAPTYGGSLPHDLVHLLVEGAFGLRRGFWGRIQAGGDPAAINIGAPRARERGYSAWGPDREELLIAEALAATHWFDPSVGDGPRLHAIAQSCVEFDIEMPTRFNLNHVAGATLAMRLSRDIYAVKSWLDVSFSPEAPHESFAALLERLEQTHAELDKSRRRR